MKTKTYKLKITGLLMMAFLMMASFSQSQNNCIPDSLTSTNITEHSANLAWVGIAGPTHVRYYAAGTTNYEIMDTHMNHVCLHNLTPNTLYSWDLSNFCNGEWTAYTGNGSFTTLTDTIPPPPPPICIPTDLTAANVTAHEVDLTWGGIQGSTWVRYAPTGDTIYRYEFAHNGNHVSLHRLAPGTEYSWDLNNFCNGQWTGYLGNGSFTTLTDTIPPPPPNCIPTDLAAINISGNSADLSWGGITGPTHVRYFVTGTTDYICRYTDLNTITIDSLMANTSYSWDLSNFCDGVWTPYAGDGIFSTLSEMYLTGIGTVDGQSSGNLSNLTIFPNPLLEKATVSFSSTDDGTYVCKIMDVTGRELSATTLQASLGTTKFELNLTGHQKGIYFLHLQKGSEVKIIKLIKLQ